MAWLIVGAMVVWILWLVWALCHVAREADEQAERMAKYLRANDYSLNGYQPDDSYRLHRDLHKGDRD